MRDSASPVSVYLAELELCTRHPARRAIGYCDACLALLCRSCALPVHRCRGEAMAPAASRAASRHAPPLAILALTLPAAIVLAGVALRVRQPTGPAAPGPATPPAVAPTAAALPSVPPARLPESSRLPASGGISPGAAPAPARPAVLPSPLPIPDLASPSSRVRPFEPRPRSSTAFSFDRGSPRRKAILLSFDAGAEASGAAEILDALAAASVQTTFFITGDFIRSHPELVRRLVREGHEVGNHTDTHPHLTTYADSGRHETRMDLTREVLLAELERTEAAFRALTGGGMARIWRAPFGEHNLQILGWAASGGWSHVGWTRALDTLDWVSDPSSRMYRSPAEIARRILEFPRADDHRAHGSIVLMHLGSDRPAEERLARALPEIMIGLRDQGFELVTASDMMRGS